MLRRLPWYCAALAALAACGPASDTDLPLAPPGGPELGPPPPSNNVPPSVAITAPLDGATLVLGPSGVTVDLTADITYADPGDTHTCGVDWQVAGTVGTVTESNGNGTCAASFALTAVGSYVITVTVIDPMGGTAMDSVTVTVVAAPPAPAPTGGTMLAEGQIRLQPGAYPDRPQRQGRVTFAVIARTSAENGRLRARSRILMHAAGLNFLATSFQSLVVDGCRGTLTGQGRVNGRGSYGFEVIGIDASQPGCGTADRIRIRIWRENRVLMDTEPVVTQSNDPTTTLERGRVIVLP